MHACICTGSAAEVHLQVKIRREREFGQVYQESKYMYLGDAICIILRDRTSSDKGVEECAFDGFRMRLTVLSTSRTDSKNINKSYDQLNNVVTEQSHKIAVYSCDDTYNCIPE